MIAKSHLAFLLMLSACDPAWQNEGHLIDGSGAPVAGATVTLVCPSGPTVTTSDATGTFQFGGVGSAFEAPKCGLVIEKLGFAKRTLRTRDVCYHNSEDGTGGLAIPCRPGEGTVILSPL